MEVLGIARVGTLCTMVLTPPPPPAPRRFPAPVTGRRTGAPGIVAVLGLAVVLLVEYVVALGPWLLFDAPYLSELAGLGLTAVPFVLYVGLVVAVARSAVRRVAAASTAVAALVFHVVFWFVLRHAPSSLDSLDDLRLLGWISGAVVGMLLVASWGIARRTGAVWWIGVAIVPALVAGQALVADEFARKVWEIAGDIDWPGARGRIAFDVTVWTTWTLVPLLAAGFACWVLDQLAPGRADERR